MAIREIVTIPDPVLREVSKPVERLDEDFQKLLDDMAETMYDAPGIGLAAVQLGIPLRVFVTDIGPNEDEEGEEDAHTASELPEDLRDAVKREPVELPKKPIFFINPEIVQLSGEPFSYNEGCLSIPDYYAEVERPEKVIIKYLDRHGKEQLMEADSLQSTCIQHEFDHLEGKLFIDYLSRLKRDRVIKKFTKLARSRGNMV